jgi:zinc transport system substrate-binding protein
MKRTNIIKKSGISFVAILLLLAGGAAVLRITGNNRVSDNEKLSVAATFYPLYEFSRQIGGEKVNVFSVVPTGAEPHDYEPSPQELVRAYEADVFVYNGELMEPWVDSFLTDYRNFPVKASNSVALKEEAFDDDHTHSHRSNANDPHFWLDPVHAQQIVLSIRDSFIQTDPDNKQYYIDNADIYIGKLRSLDQDFADGLRECTLDTVISSHAALGYLAHRYNFKVLSIAGIEPNDEPVPGKMAEISNVVRQKNIRYILTENLGNSRLAETIAHETGAEILTIHPIEGLSETEREKGKDYISVQYDNLSTLRQALDCK